MFKKQTSILLFAFIFSQLISGNVSAGWPEDSIMGTECEDTKPIRNGSKSFSSVDGKITYKFECKSEVEAVKLKESTQNEISIISPMLPITSSNDQIVNYLTPSDADDKKEITTSEVSDSGNDNITFGKPSHQNTSYSTPVLRPNKLQHRRSSKSSDVGFSQETKAVSQSDAELDNKSQLSRGYKPQCRLRSFSNLEYSTTPQSDTDCEFNEDELRAQQLFRNEKFLTWIKSKATAEGHYRAETGEPIMEFKIKCSFLCDKRNIRLNTIKAKSKSYDKEWRITNWHSTYISPNQYLIVVKFNSWHGDGIKFRENFEGVDNVNVSIECDSHGNIKFYTLDGNFFKTN